MKPFVYAADDLLLNISAVIEASAGTGKSYTIRRLVIRALESGTLSISEILIVTFTRATAAEMQRTLREAIVKRKHELETNGDLEHSVALTRLTNALADYDNAQVLTIHSFANAVLDQFAFEAGRPWQSQASEELAQQILKETTADWIQASVQLLNQGTKGFRLMDAIEATFKRLDTFADLVHDLARKEIYPGSKRYPNLVFTPKATNCRIELDVEHYLRALCKEWKTKITTGENYVQTLLNTGLCTRKLTPKKQTLLAGVINQLWDALETEQDIHCVKGLMVRIAGISTKDGCNGWMVGIEAGDAFDFLLAMERLEKIPALAAVYKAAREIASLARTRMAKQGIITFDAMIADLRDALDGSTEETVNENGISSERRDLAKRLQAALQKRFPMVLFDEAQDTDPDQWRIFHTLFVTTPTIDAPNNSTSTKGNVLFLVGDPKQSIYRFRGSDLDSYLEARDEILNTLGGTRCQLGINYRSTTAMVRAIDTLLLAPSIEGPVEKEALFTEWTAETPTDQITYNGVDTQPNNTKLVLFDNKGQDVSPVSLCVISDQKTGIGRVRNRYVRWLAGHILSLLTDDYSFKSSKIGDDSRPVKPGDIAILCRTAREGRACMSALRTVGVPSVFERSENVGDGSTALEFLNVLQALANPNDIKVVRGALYTYWSGLSVAEQRNLTESETAVWQGRFQQWAQTMSSSYIGKVIQEIIEPNDGNWGLRGVSKAPTEHLRRAADLVQLGQWLESVMSKEALTVDALPSRFNDVIQGNDKVAQYSEGNDDAVRVLTLHSAKGLEYPIVMLGGGITAKNPSSRDKHAMCTNAAGEKSLHFRCYDKEPFLLIAAENSLEDDRLLYVAMTRAVSYFVAPVAESTTTSKYKCMISRLLPDLTDPVCNWLKAQKLASVPSLSLFQLHDVDAKDILEHSSFVSASDSPQEWTTTLATHRLDATRQFTSFTKMTKHPSNVGDVIGRPADDEADTQAGDDVDGALTLRDMPLPQRPKKEKSPSNLAISGTRLGNLVHKLFEHILGLQRRPNATLPIHQDIICERAMSLLRAEGITVDDMNNCNVQAILNMVMGTLATELTPGVPIGYCAAAFAEVPFLLLESDKEDVKSTLSGERIFEIPQGLLTGNIDAIFETPAGLWIVDWKTNHLPGYSTFDMEAAMNHHRYGLQGTLYRRAIDRAKLGQVVGILYIFVRAFENGFAVDGEGVIRF